MDLRWKSCGRGNPRWAWVSGLLQFSTEGKNAEGSWLKLFSPAQAQGYPRAALWVGGVEMGRTAEVTRAYVCPSCHDVIETTAPWGHAETPRCPRCRLLAISLKRFAMSRGKRPRRWRADAPIGGV